MFRNILPEGNACGYLLMGSGCPIPVWRRRTCKKLIYNQVVRRERSKGLISHEVPGWKSDAKKSGEIRKWVRANGSRPAQDFCGDVQFFRSLFYVVTIQLQMEGCGCELASKTREWIHGAVRKEFGCQVYIKMYNWVKFHGSVWGINKQRKNNKKGWPEAPGPNITRSASNKFQW